MIYKILGIAINDYDSPLLDKIQNCKSDLNEIISIFKSRYVIDDLELLTEKEQTTHKYIYSRLYEYFINSSEDENIIIIYCGHGEYNDIIGASYWLPSDSEPDHPSTWFNLNDLLSFVKISPAIHISIISDSCFSGAIFESASRGGGIQALDKKLSREALTSGSIEKVSDGTAGTSSPFAEKLCEILKNNFEKVLPFSKLSNDLILNFDEDRRQTPMFGTIANVGDKGGTMILQLKDELDDEISYNEISLSLNIDYLSDLDYSCNIPFFLENKHFDNIFVNSYIQQLAYSIISDTRSFINDDKSYIITQNKEVGFYLFINYTVHTLNTKYLSMTLTIENYFGGVHPNNYIHSLNISFKPDRKLNLDDVVQFGNFQKFIKLMIKKYGDNKEHKEVLNNYVEYINYNNLDFSIDKDKLHLYFLNFMPRVVMALGFLEIPIKEIKFKL
jgi:hypothetical protein